MNIGVLGGTFDPVHNGHLLVAEEAMSRLNLARVLFVPAGQPWLKDAAPLAASLNREGRAVTGVRRSSSLTARVPENPLTTTVVAVTLSTSYSVVPVLIRIVSVLRMPPGRLTVMVSGVVPLWLPLTVAPCLRIVTVAPAAGSPLWGSE